MNRILNVGSVNIDHVYAVDHFVRPGETLPSRSYRRFSGGKGFNQSVALARAGARVWHAGRIGQDGEWLAERLRREGVDTSLLRVAETPTGHAIIQVVPEGQNAILLDGGANRCVTPEDAVEALAGFGPGDWLLLQNEVSAVPDLIARGAERGMTVALNTAPMTEAVRTYPLDRVGLLIVNELEAEQLSGAAAPDAALVALRRRFPRAAVVLTLGAEGAVYADATQEVRVPALKVAAVDTTAAGDTFIGFFLAELTATGDVGQALRLGCRAAAVCVTRPGAADSIPTRAELDSATREARG